MTSSHLPPPSSTFIYGTAWKRDQTAVLVHQALGDAGFTAVDTAGQPKHYREDLVGVGLREVFGLGRVTHHGDEDVISKETGREVRREEIWIQTKFSRPSAQDPENCPYPLDASVEDQVHASVASSLRNLVGGSTITTSTEEKQPVEDASAAAVEVAAEKRPYLDAVLLHSPFPDFSLTLRAWLTLSTYVPHTIHHLGVSNIDLPTLEELYNHPSVTVKPSIVQLRFHPETQYQVALRKFCREHAISFQGHRVLKGNADLIGSGLVGDIAGTLGVEKEVGFYLLVMKGLGIAIVNGTKTESHMKDDLRGLQDWEIWVEQSDSNAKQWEAWVSDFKSMIREES